MRLLGKGDLERAFWDQGKACWLEYRIYMVERMAWNHNPPAPVGHPVNNYTTRIKQL